MQSFRSAFVMCIELFNLVCLDHATIAGKNNSVFDAYICVCLKVTECLPEKAKLGKTFKKDAKIVTAHLASLSPESIAVLENNLQSNGLVSRA